MAIDLNIGAQGIAADTLRRAESVVGEPVTLALSKAWIGISTVAPARTNDDALFSLPSWVKTEDDAVKARTVSVETEKIDRYDSTKLYSLQIGDYFMPVSQTFDLSASKKLNFSDLVDGPTIIHQTRKQSKTINCTLRLTLRDNQPNLSIVQAERAQEAENAMFMLAQFLQEFYEQDTVLAISNQTINEVFGVSHVMITDYKFTPRTGMGTFMFEFKLTEVLYGENVVTFNLTTLDADLPSEG